MKARSGILAALAMFGASAALGQQNQEPAFGEVLVTAQRQNAKFYRQDRPVVGLRRQADGAVMSFTITSDTRDEPTRRQEIHTVVLAAIDRAAASGFELVSGSFQLEKITRENYKELPLLPAGRIDTSMVVLMVKTGLDGSADSTQMRLLAFLKTLKKSGRATMETTGTITLTVINPDQYRDQIIGLVAEDARHNAAIFGPGFSFNVSGIDLPVGWSQVSSTEVFLFLPYRYNINPR
jgi:hypothetical protein